MAEKIKIFGKMSQNTIYKLHQNKHFLVIVMEK